MAEAAAERLINLALFLAGTTSGVTAEECRASVIGYPADQDDAAFYRMFERDKSVLRAAGLPIEVGTDGETESYRLDASAFAAPIPLSDGERAALSAAGAAMLTDPSFPLADDLRYALAKVASTAEATPVASRLADEAPELQGETAATLAAAVTARKRVSFGYTNISGQGGRREVEPFGLFLREGRWYLVGRDVARDEPRTYALTRMTDLTVNEAKPRTPDFERPEYFDIASFVLLPFQYGPVTTERRVRFSAEAAWRAERLAAGQGSLEAQSDGSVVWTVPVASDARLLRWIVENGPGVLPADPELRALLTAGLRGVVEAHAR